MIGQKRQADRKLLVLDRTNNDLRLSFTWPMLGRSPTGICTKIPDDGSAKKLLPVDHEQPFSS